MAAEYEKKRKHVSIVFGLYGRNGSGFLCVKHILQGFNFMHQTLVVL